MEESGLARAYVAAGGSADDSLPQQEALLASICAAAADQVRVDAIEFVAYLAKHYTGELQNLLVYAGAAAELALCFGIRHGAATAAEAFEAHYVTPLGPRLSKLRLSESELDEVKQLVRHKLLVVDEADRLRLEQYAGQGRLAGLVQVVATREALSLFRKQRRFAPDAPEALEDPVLQHLDPGLEMLKGRAREAFRKAFAHAVRRLDARQRNLLRLHLLGGVTLERLATMYDVNRATIVRWLARAREECLANTRAELGQDLDLSGSELDSVMHTLQSRLDVSVERLFATWADEAIEVDSSPGSENKI